MVVVVRCRLRLMLAVILVGHIPHPRVVLYVILIAGGIFVVVLCTRVRIEAILILVRCLLKP